MNTEQFLKERKALLDKKAIQEAEINKEYTRILNEFKKENSPVQKQKVYELQENGRKRRGFKRIVIYDIDVAVWDADQVMIRAGGWWLDKNNIPTKWDTMTVVGVSNNAVFKLSDDQTAEKHPEANDNN